MKEKKLYFDLCLFGNADGEGNSGEEQQPETYTQEEFEKKLQSETDKRVTEALKTAQEKWQKEFEEKLEAERSEAEKMAKLSAEERAKKEFEQQQEALAKERADFERDKLELEVRKELSKQGMDEEFAPFLMQADAETSLKNIATFKVAYDKAVEAAVKEQLKGEPPAGGGGEPEPKDAFAMLNAKYN